MQNTQTRSTFGEFMSKVYGVMGIGVLFTALVSALLTFSPELMSIFISTNDVVGPGGEVVQQMSLTWWFWGAVIAELVLVLFIAFGAVMLPAGASWLLFMVFAGLNGITLTPSLLLSTGENIFIAFFMAIIVFTVAAVYGHRTKKDLTNLGGILMVGLISLIIAMIINIFIGSSLLMMGISAIAVVLFTILTAYDVQAFRKIHTSWPDKSEGSLVVFAALSMYLNLLNLFIHILRLLRYFNGR